MTSMTARLIADFALAFKTRQRTKCHWISLRLSSASLVSRVRSGLPASLYSRHHSTNPRSSFRPMFVASNCFSGARITSSEVESTGTEYLNDKSLGCSTEAF